MKKYIILLLAAVLSWMSCRKDFENTEVTSVDAIPVKYAYGAVSGLVVNEAGQAVAGATVYFNDIVTTTDNNGVFSFPQSRVNINSAYIRVSHPQYFHGSRTIVASPGQRNQVKIRLLSNTTTQTIDGATGGTANWNEYSIQLPANAIANYNGPVHIAAKWLNPESDVFDEIMPGRLSGVRADGSGSGLVSMGMLAVELRSTDGQRLQLAPGKTATIRMKVPDALLSKAASTIPLWYFDEEYGLWKEEGEASLVNGYYEGQVQHFTFWNYDYPAPLVEVTLDVKDQNNNPVPNAYIKLSIVNSTLSGFGFTDSLGQVVAFLPQNELLDAEVSIPSTCSTPVLITQVGPFSQNDTHTFNVNLQSPDIYTVSGQLLDCNGNPVSYGYVRLAGYNTIFWTDYFGHFNTTIAACNNPASLSLTGYDLTGLNQSQVVSANVSNNAANFGAISTCTALDEYLVYNFPPGQSITILNAKAKLAGTVLGNNDVIQINAYTNTQFRVGIDIANFTGVGTYQPFNFVANGPNMGLFINHGCENGTSGMECNDLTIIVTEFGGVGGYTAGTYSGTLYNIATGAPLTVSGSFRVQTF